MKKQEALDQLIYDAANAILAAIKDESYVPSRKTVTAVHEASKAAFNKRHTWLAREAENSG